MNNAISMTQVRGYHGSQHGHPPPREAGGAPFSMLGETMKHQGLSTAKRVLIYNPDAVGMWLFQKYTTWVCSCTSAHPAGGCRSAL